ncbi:MAG: hypothetical protein IT385_20250 [Deltaproteobacteria bacterium]|nr:hypothetical protein [Deltaproteobacteria bacterium]
MTRSTLEELARVPRWPLEWTLALPGEVRGNSLRNWGVHVRRRFGPNAPSRVRELIGVPAEVLPDEPTKKHWVPVHTQIRMVQAIIDEFLGGDPLPFQSIFEDTTGAAEKVMVLAGRMAGPGMVLRMAGSYHESVCSVGKCVPTVDGGAATLEFRGAAVFADPTWRFVQAVGMKGIFTTLKRRLELLEGEGGDDAFKIHMRWR